MPDRHVRSPFKQTLPSGLARIGMSGETIRTATTRAFETGF